MKSGINRRQFMQKSLVGAAATPLVLHAIGHAAEAAAQTTSPNDRIQVGMIGVGARVLESGGLLNAVVAVPGVEVVGVCDAYRGRVTRALANLGGRAKDYGDWRAVLADKSIDAVVIGTPDHWHKPMTLEALAAGKDVYVEKPMTYSIDEGPEMYAAAEKAGRILQVGSQGKSSKLQETAKEIIKSGKLGEINLVRASFDRNSESGAWIYPIPPDANEKTVNWEAFTGSAPKRPFSLERFFRWRAYWDYSGGIATDLFVHLMTTIHYVMDATVPEMVMATGANYRHKKTHEVPDTLNASVVYGKENFSVSLSGTFNSASAGESGFAILGNEGSLVFRGDRMTFTPEHVVEGNALDRRVVAARSREGVLGRPGRPEEGEAGDLAVADVERRRVVDRSGPRRHEDPHEPLLRGGAHAPAQRRGRPRRPPRVRGPAHGERVVQAEGAGVLGLREGRPEEGVGLLVPARPGRGGAARAGARERQPPRPRRTSAR